MGLTPSNPQMIIVVDTREQKPYSFASISPSPIIITSTLKSGDYSIQGYEDQITIERKSLIDCFSSFGKGRKRFEAELARMSCYTFAAVVIEADWQTILRFPPSRSKLNSKTIYTSVIAWQIRYGIHFWAVPNRAFAEKTTYRFLERFHKDITDGKRL